MSEAMIIDQCVEVIPPRRRERNAGRILEVLPPAPDAKVAALEKMTPEQRITHVTDLVSACQVKLVAAVADQDIMAVRHAKDQSVAIALIVKQVQLGEEVERFATVFRWRAERLLGVAIRQGQDRGEILAKGEGGGWSHLNGHLPDHKKTRKMSPREFCSKTDLANFIYPMTDGVTDEQFEKALEETIRCPKPSRATLIRNLKLAKSVTGDLAGKRPPCDEPTPPAKKRLTKHDSTQMLANINGMLNGIVESIPFIDPSDIDAASNKFVITNIHHSMKNIRTLLKEIQNG